MKKNFLFAIGLTLVLGLGTVSLTRADEGGNGSTWDTSACTYTDSQGITHVGSQCNVAATNGPCSFQTACH